MIVSELYFETVASLPNETKSVLIIDSYAVLPFAIAFQGFELVAGNRRQIAQRDCPVQMDEFADCNLADGLELPRELLRFSYC